MAGDGDLSEGERSVLILHPHWKTVLLPVLLLVLVVVVAAVLVAVIPHNKMQGDERIAVGVLAALVALIWTGIPFLRWRTTTYELTTRRFRPRSGILSPSARPFPLLRPSDVTFSSP